LPEKFGFDFAFENYSITVIITDIITVIIVNFLSIMQMILLEVVCVDNILMFLVVLLSSVAELKFVGW